MAIYHELQNENAPGDWTAINCLVLDNPTPCDIETIRVTAHLVGAREWPAYEKARYLHHLRNIEFMDYDELICARRGTGWLRCHSPICFRRDLPNHAS